MELYSHEYFMNEALKEAYKAFDKDEVPIGAIIVNNKQIIARSHNLTETLNDVTAHAEMQAFTSASNFLGGKYLHDCTLYVTVEPCNMCASASYWTQINEIVFGATDYKRGFSKSGQNLIHPKTKIIHGVLEKECGKLISDFFKLKRKNKG